MKTLFNKRGDPVAYISDDYRKTIYLNDGSPVAYLYNQSHVYGVNGRHLGWWIEEIIYNHDGERIGFTYGTCPVSVGREPAKTQRQSMDKIRPRWEAPPLPKLSFNFSDMCLKNMLRDGRVVRSYEESLPAESQT